ncbi:MAG: cupin [Cereibacter sphaeroides]|uniref:Cupin n=1 Tax=Cereibacter sphaeroides TaxID=1063 RepID=A0A2W5S8Q3_CERSP|nr:MAG: cupin [Cereibacter sphaeroides]
MVRRHPAIIHWSDIEKTAPYHYDNDDELMAFNAPLARHFGLQRLGIHHERLPPGRRLSYPHAESAEEEFVYVIDGTPDVWLDGEIHRLAPGDAVGFPAGTGLAHTFLNNTETEVRLLVIGEKNKPENRIFYAVNPRLKEVRSDWWHDAPERQRGPHDGLTDARRRDIESKD